MARRRRRRPRARYAPRLMRASTPPRAGSYHCAMPIRFLFQPGTVPDANYMMVRDRPLFAYNKDLIERMWQEFAPLCPDRHFLEDAKTHFHARTWEMYLARSE